MKKENLVIISATSYANGEAIPKAQDFETWKKYNNNKQGAYCVYIDEEDKETTHILYNWFVLNGEQEIIPKGLKLADSSDWAAIETELQKDTSLQVFLKNGQRQHFGFFGGKGKAGYYWSNITTEHNADRATFFSILNDGDEIFEADADKRLGFSILCVKQ